MADKKITQLDPLTGANLADTDEFVVVDLSADETKSITFAELKTGLDTVTGFVRISGDTMTGNLTVPNVVVTGTVDGVDIAARDAVLTSTTTTANAALPKSGGTVTGDLTVQGAFTSQGIDDNANAIAITIDSSENVGIGTSSPTAILDVRRGDASGKIAEFHTSTGFGIELGSSQSEAYIQAGSSQALLFNTNVSNERMRLDSSGRLLVAKTTTAFGTVGHTIWNDGSHDLTASAIPPIQANRLTSDGDIIALYKASSKVGSIGNSGTNFIIQQSNASGVVQIKNHDSTEDIEFGQDYFRIKQGGAERFKIDSSGNLIKNGGGLISSNGTADTLVISGSNAVNTGGNITLEGNAASDASQIKFKNGSTEVMRVAGGNVFLGKSASNNLAGIQLTSDGQGYFVRDSAAVLLLNRLGSDGTVVQFYNDSNGAGSISVSGSSTAYNTSSDYRLKTDVQPMVGASERVQALNPVNFEWVADGTRVDGFLAHEAATVVPEAIYGSKDAVDADGNAVMQGIDQSKLVPLLTAALREALTEITALKARVTALEGA